MNYLTSKSPFVDIQNNETSDFSFKNIFKKKEGEKQVTSVKNVKNEKEKEHKIGAGILTGITGLIGLGASLAPVLPEIGIGSKSRIAEINANANANTQILNAQNQLLLTQQKAKKKNQDLLIFGGVAVFILIIIIIVMSRK